MYRVKDLHVMFSLGDDYVQERVDGVLANVVDQRDTIVENIMVSEPLCEDMCNLAFSS